MCCNSQLGVVYVSVFFFFNDTATTEIYTLSLHDALPIWARRGRIVLSFAVAPWLRGTQTSKRSFFSASRTAVATSSAEICGDRKSTRLNSSHANISYAVFCLKKKKKTLLLIQIL